MAGPETLPDWGGQGIHPRGNFNAFVQAPLRPLPHDNGWDRTPPVTLNVRQPGERFVPRHEHEWPLAHTQWTKMYRDSATMTLSRRPVAPAGTVAYDALGAGVTFSWTVERETEITGPSPRSCSSRPPRRTPTCS